MPLEQERKSKPDQSDPRRHSRQLIELVRKQPIQDTRQRPRYGQQDSRPARQDPGAEGSDAKQQEGKYE